MNVSALWAAIVDLAIASGATPQTLWNTTVGPWEIWVNATSAPAAIPDASVRLPEFEVLIRRDGWPVGMLGPGGGALVLPGWHHDVGTVEDQLIADVKQATAERAQ